MDQDVFRETYNAVNERFCPYEKSILTNQCRCCESERFLIAEREGVRCVSDESQGDCVELLDLLRQNARFSLKSQQTAAALPHAKAMRIQVGGLRGIRSVLAPQEPPPLRIDDIRGLIVEAKSRFDGLRNLPFSEIMREIVAYRGRKPSSKRGNR